MQLLLIGIPLWAILKLAQRQAAQQQYEEAVRHIEGQRRMVLRVQPSGVTRVTALPV